MTGTNITAYDEKLAAMAAAQQAIERSSGGRDFFSTKAGQLVLNDEAMPGNQIAAIILDSYREQDFFAGKYSDNNKAPPICYSFGRGSEDEMQPHIESMQKSQDYFMPQHFDANGNIAGCKGCPKNEWGTADVGEGKACKSKYRLTLLPAGIYEPVGKNDLKLGVFDTLEEFKGVEPAILSVPVTSGKLFSDYTRMLRTKHGRPPLGVYTRIHLTPHKDHQFHINFDLIEEVPNELLGYMIERGEAEVAEPFRGYEKPQEQQQEQRRGFTRR